MSVSKTIIIGRLGADPELRNVGDGQVCSMRVAVTEKWATGEHTEWYTVDVWGRQADACAKHLTKGRQVYVEGSMRSREYTDNAGVKRRVWALKARDVKFLGGDGHGARRQGGDGWGSGGGEW